jgi:hypothetical protein
MGCLLVLMGGLFPRFGVLIVYLARPVYFTAAFGNTWIWPILGIIFLPFTTLMYVLLWGTTGGLSGFDWVWLALAVMIDLGHYAGGAYGNRDRMPGYQAGPSNTNIRPM